MNREELAQAIYRDRISVLRHDVQTGNVRIDAKLSKAIAHDAIDLANVFFDEWAQFTSDQLYKRDPG